ncbi:MAG: DUF1816 domain-containing protein [Hydrococcus sp. Prado102]|jgi:hypothetical protein|nr:DUF1816 domain-containing protein [Hydrococcus sp. Prado102]
MLGVLLLGFYFIVASIFVYYFKNYNSQQWWIQIKTKFPVCIYYFGPFDSFQEAENHRNGYLEDLQAEGSREIITKIGRYHPQELTIFEEETELISTKK